MGTIPETGGGKLVKCHEMSELMFGGRDSAELLSGADDPGEAALADYFSAREAALRGVYL